MLRDADLERAKVLREAEFAVRAQRESATSGTDAGLSLVETSWPPVVASVGVAVCEGPEGCSVPSSSCVAAEYEESSASGQAASSSGELPDPCSAAGAVMSVPQERRRRGGGIVAGYDESSSGSDR